MQPIPDPPMKLVGPDFEVLPYNADDAEDARMSRKFERLRQDAQEAKYHDAFGRWERPHTKTPSVRSQPYGKGPKQLRFAEDLSIKCEAGHVPTYMKGQTPFKAYGLPATYTTNPCKRNGPNMYLSWDNEKSKYCCQSAPDDNDKIMTHALHVIHDMIANVTIDTDKTRDAIEHAKEKYLQYFELVHSDSPDKVNDEKQKINALIAAHMVRLNTTPEQYSKREERMNRLNAYQANQMPQWSLPPPPPRAVTTAKAAAACSAKSSCSLLGGTRKRSRCRKRVRRSLKRCHQ